MERSGGGAWGGCVGMRVGTGDSPLPHPTTRPVYAPVRARPACGACACPVEGNWVCVCGGEGASGGVWEPDARTHGAHAPCPCARSLAQTCMWRVRGACDPASALGDPTPASAFLARVSSAQLTRPTLQPALQPALQPPPGPAAAAAARPASPAQPRSAAVPAAARPAPPAATRPASLGAAGRGAAKRGPGPDGTAAADAAAPPAGKGPRGGEDVRGGVAGGCSAWASPAVAPPAALAAVAPGGDGGLRSAALDRLQVGGCPFSFAPSNETKIPQL